MGDSVEYAYVTSQDGTHSTERRTGIIRTESFAREINNNEWNSVVTYGNDVVDDYEYNPLNRETDGDESLHEWIHEEHICIRKKDIILFRSSIGVSMIPPSPPFCSCC